MAMAVLDSLAALTCGHIAPLCLSSACNDLVRVWYAITTKLNAYLGIFSVRAKLQSYFN